MNTDFSHLLRARGVLRSTDATLTPLTGGVSSEIYRADDSGRVFVVKRALAKLKVAAEWFADTRRNAHEQAYLTYVARFRPDAVPAVLAGGEDEGWFAMEFLEGFANWKSELLVGRADPGTATRAAAILGEIHARSHGDATAQRRFATDANFHELRIAPYLLATAERAENADLRRLILDDAAALAARREALVHGDFSPKNLLVRPDRLVVLDCEVAWYGDPAFDVAFLLAHLLLKALHHAPEGAAPLRPLFDAALAAYREAQPTLAEPVLARTPRLLRWLLLARVDGKSPVEYLAPEKQACVRRFVRTHTLDAPPLEHFADRWFAALASTFP
jgi:aminoglycoside phosphotransferase (APT) family kinase protein